ncbi:hypothetical protein HanXRQr2_Chr12g0551681 [Helianthus annuus]|uniref:Uncharacterized protein n=1 Tax=Helianthus annuus TaxID=4232 RepID=A0A9K3HI33_HELAN|nr:hypothetical protein HanXRQr2_Chr12g0551681 [Helianthus annuus]KAJ0863529.1 hypothetical protein HanPSC8_Chr12g0531131 [Helianthus annuus]
MLWVYTMFDTPTRSPPLPTHVDPLPSQPPQLPCLSKHPQIIYYLPSFGSNNFMTFPHTSLQIFVQYFVAHRVFI